jgi:signal transduction histidine kinase
VRQELSAPAIAIMGYAEMLMDDAAQSDRGQLADDLQRILDASRNLHSLILSLLDPATIHPTEGSADLAEYRRTLRHDLRTPINAIKGYGEMLREDAADGGADTLVADLDKLLGQATLLLDRIDGLVTFSGTEAPPSNGIMELVPLPPRQAHRRGWSRTCSRRSAPLQRRKRTLRP